MLSPLTKTNNERSSRKTLEFGRERLQTYERGNNDKLIFTNQSCLQYKPWKCPRKQLTVWYGRYRAKTWHSTANTITNNSELYPKVLNSVNRNASNEMSEYLHDKIQSMLCNKPDEITRFSHRSASFLSRDF